MSARREKLQPLILTLSRPVPPGMAAVMAQTDRSFSMMEIKELAKTVVSEGVFCLVTYATESRSKMAARVFDKTTESYEQV